jgi:hypothetical protein
MSSCVKAQTHLHLLQVSFSLSCSIDPLLCTLHEVARRGGARKRDLSTSENFGSKLNRKCKTCFNCFLEIEGKQLKQVFHFRFSFEPRFSEVDKSPFLAPPLRATLCNVHYSGSTLYDNEKRDLQQV